MLHSLLIAESVVLLSENEDVGGQIPVRYKARIEPWFKDHNVEVIRSAECTSIGKKSVTIKTPEDEREIKCDSVMIMLPERRDGSLYDSLKDLVPEIYEVGSTLGEPHSLLKHAVLDGRVAAVEMD